MRPIADIASFHAHVYFEGAEEAAAARRLREAVAPDLFARLVPWLMLNHQRLSILIHPNSGWPRDDHLLNAIWIGPPLPLNQDLLPEREEVAEAAGAPNTAPTRNP